MVGRRHRLVSSRTAAGFSQERLAEAVGVERSTVMRWERGETRPQPWARPRLARALGISDQALSELLGESTDPLKSPETQALLDTALDRAPDDVKTHFTRAPVSSKHEQTTGLDAATAAARPAADPAVEALHGDALHGDGMNLRQTFKATGAGAVLYPRNGQVMGLRELVLNAAHSSALLHSAINTPKVEDRTLDEAREDLRRLATDYVVNSELTHIVPDLVILRDRLYVLLVRYGQRPGDARELNLLLGATCILLASVSHDLDEPSAAMVQTHTALAFAEHAGMLG